MSEFQIQKAQLVDIEWIADAQVSMADETENLQLNQQEVVKGISFIFSNPARGFYIIAKHQQQPVACLMILNEWSDWRNGDVWWIHSVYILPAFRKRGIFKKMFDYVEVLARNSGVSGLRLYVDKSNVTAHKVYEKLEDFFEKNWKALQGCKNIKEFLWKIGELSGDMDYLLVGQVSVYSPTRLIITGATARLIDVRTGEMLITAMYTIPKKGWGTAQYAGESLAAAIKNEVSRHSGP